MIDTLIKDYQARLIHDSILFYLKAVSFMMRFYARVIIRF